MVGETHPILRPPSVDLFVHYSPNVHNNSTFGVRGGSHVTATRDRFIMQTPFLATEALTAGTVTRYQLKTSFEPVHRNVYIRKGEALTPVTRAVAAWLWSGRRAVIAGLSAAALHKTKWIDDHLPAELNRASRDKTRGIILHSDALEDDDVVDCGGIRLTTPVRTAYDLGRRRGLLTALIRVDALARATDLKAADVALLAEQHRGARGIVQLRRVLRLMDAGSESPQETHTRLALVSAGLPRPQTQIVVTDAGRFVARLDMGWEEYLVGVEFDGAQHWTDPVQRTRDIDRLAELEELGWRIVRVSAEMLRQRPHAMIGRIREALRSAGAPV